MDALVELGLIVPHITPDAFRSRADTFVALSRAASAAASDVRAATRAVLDANVGPTADAFAAHTARSDGTIAAFEMLATDSRALAHTYQAAADALASTLAEIAALDAHYQAELDALGPVDDLTRARGCAALLPGASEELEQIETRAVEEIEEIFNKQASADDTATQDERWRSTFDGAPASAAELIDAAATRLGRHLGIRDTRVEVRPIDGEAGFDWERGTLLLAPETLEQASVLDALRHELHHARFATSASVFPTFAPGSSEAARWSDVHAGVPRLPSGSAR